MTSVSVVLADDTEALRYLIGSVLEEDARFEVIGEASNGQEALDQVVSLKPDLLLLDLSMPVMDGLEVLERLRAQDCATKVIVLSGYAAEAAAEASIERGALAYIEKGVRPKDLIASLADLLELDDEPAHTDGEATPMGVHRIRPHPDALSLDGVVNSLVHDLRSPLGLATGYLDLLQNTLESSDQRALAERTMAAIQRLDTLVTALAVYARKNPEHSTLGEIDVEAKLHATVAELRREHLTATEHVRVHPARSSPTVKGDPSLLDEALRHVLDNALRYAGDGPIDVHVDGDDHRLRVTVLDRGPGVNTEDEALVFRPFGRGTAARGKPGAGLGLPLTARLLQLVDGRIWVERNEPAGLKVVVEVPRRPTSRRTHA